MGELDGEINKQRGEVDGSVCRIQSTLNAGDDTKSQRGDSFNLNSLPCVAAYRKDDSFEDPVVGSKEDSLELTGNEKSSNVVATNVVRSEEYTDSSVLGNKDGSSKVFGNEERSDCAAVVKKDEPIKISEDRECTNGDGVARKDDSAKESGNEEKGGIAIVKKDDSLESTSCSVTAMANCENNSDKKIGGIAGRISAVKSPIPRSSNYHGVTRHRWSGKYEAHLWDNSCRVEGRRRKGKQVYLGSYDTEEKAARAYDLAALKYWGASTKLNFPVSEYEKELEDVKDMTREECVAYLRRRSSCFSRGASIYRGVTRIVVVRGFPAISPLYFFNFFIGYPSTKTYIDDRRQKDGRWQARIGLVADTRDIYLGTFKTEEEAAEAYDIAAVELRGRNAVTNFDISNYIDKGPRRVEEAGVQQQL